MAHGKYLRMAYEKLWKLIGPKSFTSNGGTDGRVTIADTVHFKVKQLVILKSSSIFQETYQVNRVESSNVLYLGPINSRIEARSDLSLFTTADSATIEAIVQPRSKIPEQEIERLTYEEEPTVARRAVLVDPYGDFYTSDSPLPVVVAAATAFAWDDIIIVRDYEGDITSATYSFLGSIVRVITLIYDANKNLIEVIKT